MRAPQRCQPGGLGLHADAQFKQRHHILQGGVALGADAKPRSLLPLGRLADEGAHAMARAHQTRRLQLGQGLAHHRAADTELGHDLGLGGQLLAHRQAPLADALAQGIDQPDGERLPG